MKKRYVALISISVLLIQITLPLPTAMRGGIEPIEEFPHALDEKSSWKMWDGVLIHPSDDYSEFWGMKISVAAINWGVKYVEDGWYVYEFAVSVLAKGVKTSEDSSYGPYYVGRVKKLSITMEGEEGMRVTHDAWDVPG